MKPRLFFMVIGMLLMGSMRLHAQSGHVYEDSAVLYPEEKVDVEVAAPMEEAPPETNSSDEETEIDTLLLNNRHFLSADSFWLLKNEKQLLYAQKLDSLLQELKKQAKPEPQKRTREQSNSPREEGDNSRSPAGSSSVANFFSIPGLQYVLWALAALFVLFILYKLFFANASFKNERLKNQVQIAEEEEVLPQSPGAYDAAIAKAVQDKNYRLATRYSYLQLLQRLSATGAIEFAVDKTNSAYLRELTGKPYKDEVAALTMYYEYAWYGGFAIDAALYSKIENRFRNIVV